MTTKNLIIAVSHISNLFVNKQISMIEFEDGSGYKFNYRLVGDNKRRFIDLSSVMKHAEIVAKF